MIADPSVVQAYAPSAISVIAVAGLLKFLVVDKLNTITKGLSSHERRIRRQEITSAALHAALQARGCLGAETCPLANPDDGEDAQ